MNALAHSGWSVVKPLAQDGSSRRYSRVEKGAITAVLMEVLGDTPGHRIEDFVRIGEWLRGGGLHAPEIYEAGADYLLLEDFGDISFKAALGQGVDADEIYGLAFEVLQHMQAQKCPLELPDYYASHVHKGHRRVIDWFVPAVLERANPEGLVEGYLSVWNEIERGLPPCPQGFVHIDYHVENLMWLPRRDGLARCGILDFQGAMRGPAPYDLGNLLEDARIDVPEDVRRGILKQYDEDFLAWYRVVTTQFHCRIIGQFIKMAVQGKPSYLQYIPRVGRYIDRALADPLLRPLQLYFLHLGLDFQNIKDLNVQRIQAYICPDAF